MPNSPEVPSSIDIIQLLDGFKQRLEIGQQKRFTFLLIGRTGVGKSSTLNSLLGKEVARVGRFEPATFAPRIYEGYVQGISCKIIDTPGLCDDQPERGNDEYYLGLIKSSVETIDCMWLVISLHDTRLDAGDKRIIRLVTDNFGKEVWDQTIVVFSFADEVSKDEYDMVLSERTRLVREEIAKYIEERKANEVPFVAVSNVSIATPDGKVWLGELYTKVLVRISDQGFYPFLLATASRVSLTGQRGDYGITLGDVDHNSAGYPNILSAPIIISRRQRREIRKTMDARIIPGLITAGAAVGTAFGPFGTAIGGTIGAAIGLIAWFFS